MLIQEGGYRCFVTHKFQKSRGNMIFDTIEECLEFINEV